MRAEFSSAHNHYEAPALPSLSLLPLQQQLEPELPYHSHELDATVGVASLSTVGDVFLDESEMEACALASGAGGSFLDWSGS